MIETLLLSAVLLSDQLNQETEETYRQQALPQLQEFYLLSGVLGPDEKQHFFNSTQTWDFDLETMRHRELSLRPDSPPFDFVVPPQQLAYRNFHLAQTFVRYLEERLKNNQEPAFEEGLLLLLDDAKWRLKVWDLLSDCSASWRDYDGKRVKLSRVRELVGKEKFDLCNWPDPLPKAAIRDWSEWVKKNEVEP